MSLGVHWVMATAMQNEIRTSVFSVGDAVLSW